MSTMLGLCNTALNKPAMQMQAKMLIFDAKPFPHNYIIHCVSLCVVLTGKVSIRDHSVCVSIVVRVMTE